MFHDSQRLGKALRRLFILRHDPVRVPQVRPQHWIIRINLQPSIDRLKRAIYRPSVLVQHVLQRRRAYAGHKILVLLLTQRLISVVPLLLIHPITLTVIIARFDEHFTIELVRYAHVDPRPLRRRVHHRRRRGHPREHPIHLRPSVRVSHVLRAP